MQQIPCYQGIFRPFIPELPETTHSCLFVTMVRRSDGGHAAGSARAPLGRGRRRAFASTPFGRVDGTGTRGGGLDPAAKGYRPGSNASRPRRRAPRRKTAAAGASIGTGVTLALVDL